MIDRVAQLWRDYWRWTTGGSKWRLATGIGGPIFVFLLVFGAVSGDEASQQAPSSSARTALTVAVPTSSPTEAFTATAATATETPVAATATPAVLGVQALVVRVIDGDTIEVDRALDGQATIRYIGVDTPETVAPGQPVACFGREASNRNKELVEGKTVYLEKDVSDADRFGRLLRYVYLADGSMVNELLVVEGFAQVSTFPPDVKHQQRFLAAQQKARSANLGLWGSCQGPAASQAPAVQPTTPAGQGNCHPSYPTVCIPPPPPDLDCGDVPYRQFQVLPPDPHRFDGSDNDGIGCESG
jgi:micrococcal nuclease